MWQKNTNREGLWRETCFEDAPARVPSKQFIMEYSVNFYCNLLQEPENFYPAELPEFVDLLNDQGFKHVFGRDANKDILIALLNEIIPDRVIVDLRHIRNEQIPSDPETKGSVFDLYCETEDGSRIVVELQNKPQLDYIDRAIYYSAFPIQNQVEKGSRKYTFNAVYVINILNFNLQELNGQDKPVSAFRFKELETNATLSEKYTIIFIELRKFTKDLDDISPDNMQEVFIHCLKNMHRHKKQPETLQQPICNRLFEAARFAAMNKQERQTYISKMNTERDLRNQLDYALSEGLAKGMAQGMAQGLAEGMAQGEANAKAAIAKAMKNKGIDTATISECTGIPIEEIGKL